MTAVPPLEAAYRPAKQGKQGGKFGIYPLLGVFLVLSMAALTYGGLFLLLVDDWSFFQPDPARKSG